jgi:hypothetical protein
VLEATIISPPDSPHQTKGAQPRLQETFDDSRDGPPQALHTFVVCARSSGLEKAAEHEIGWPLPEGMDAKALEQLFFGAGDTPKPTPGLPDWEKVATELATHQHLTLQLLWL